MSLKVCVPASAYARSEPRTCWSSQVLDEAALKVLKAAEATKQLLQQKEEVLAEIRGEFEQKNKEVSIANRLSCSTILSTQSVYMPLSQ